MKTQIKYVCPACEKPTQIRTRGEMQAVFNPDGSVNTDETNVRALDPCGQEYLSECMLCIHEAPVSAFASGVCSVCGNIASYEFGKIEGNGAFTCEGCLRAASTGRGPNFECGMCGAILPATDRYVETLACRMCVLTFGQALYDFCQSFGYSYMPLRVDRDLTGTDVPFAAIISEANAFVVMAQLTIWLSKETNLNVHRLFTNYGEHIMHTVDGRLNVLNFINCNPPE